MRVLMAAVAGAGLAACNGKDSDSGGSDIDPADLAAAEDLWDTIDGHEAWPQIDPWIGVQTSTSVHRSFVQIWVNQTAADHINAAAGGDLPDGSIIVKAAYASDDGVVGDYSVMDKDGGAWFYAQYTATGDVNTAGSAAISKCQNCHSSGQDEVLFVTW